MPHLPRLYRLLIGERAEPLAAFPLHGLVALVQENEWWVESWREV